MTQINGRFANPLQGTRGTRTPQIRNSQSTVQGTMVVVMLTDVHAVLAFFTLVALPAVLMVCVLCRKRRTEGTYRPSAEEQKQAESQESEKPGLPLPLPKEERLI
ncbi:hypothetical protein KOW79_020973 [Hemibagrus wyckioides]|uniref:Uncharacterized protein n=1 Tax=Hemibagrus wyckioides TaxID=337641 RepID=A0A9D3N5I0_9TELE|nr:hypothetical protein KOW79_020973 [Hemibagrus wyckioides]